MERDETGTQLGDYGSIPSFKNNNDKSLNWDGTERDLEDIWQENQDLVISWESGVRKREFVISAILLIW